MKVLLKRFHLYYYTIGLHPQTQKLQPPFKTASLHHLSRLHQNERGLKTSFIFRVSDAVLKGGCNFLVQLVTFWCLFARFLKVEKSATLLMVQMKITVTGCGLWTVHVMTKNRTSSKCSTVVRSTSRPLYPWRQAVNCWCGIRIVVSRLWMAHHTKRVSELITCNQAFSQTLKTGPPESMFSHKIIRD